MIRKTIPVLVHEDCMDSISVGLAKQEASIAKIAENTTTANDKLDTVIANQGTAQSKLNDIAEDTNTIEGNTTAIKTSTANINTTLNAVSYNLGSASSSSETVVALLKGINNKLTTF